MNNIENKFENDAKLKLQCCKRKFSDHNNANDQSNYNVDFVALVFYALAVSRHVTCSFLFNFYLPQQTSNLSAKVHYTCTEYSISLSNIINILKINFSIL